MSSPQVWLDMRSLTDAAAAAQATSGHAPRGALGVLLPGASSPGGAQTPGAHTPGRGLDDGQAKENAEYEEGEGVGGGGPGSAKRASAGSPGGKPAIKRPEVVRVPKFRFHQLHPQSSKAESEAMAEHLTATREVGICCIPMAANGTGSDTLVPGILAVSASGIAVSKEVFFNVGGTMPSA